MDDDTSGNAGAPAFDALASALASVSQHRRSLSAAGSRARRIDVLNTLSAEIGEAATMAIAAKFSGRHLYIPAHPREKQAMARLIGLAALRVLSRGFGCETVYIPRNPVERVTRNRLICEKLSMGLATREVAAEFGLSLRRIEQLRARLVIVQATG